MAYGMKTKDCHFTLSLANTSCRSYESPCCVLACCRSASLVFPCWAWQAIPYPCLLMNQCFQKYSSILLCFFNFFFFIGILNFNILFVLTHHLDSLVIYQVALTEHLCTDLTSIKCLCDSSKT